MDDEAPLLLTSTRIDPVSRYDLGALAFGMNIEETTGWSGPLTLSCQVRSDGVTWPVVDTVIQPDSRNGNLVLFTARVNLTGAGNPRDLGDIAYLGCWATGSDDAGRTLTAQANNDPDFPWIDLTLTDRAPDLAWERTPVVSRTRTSASIAGTYENIGSPSDRSTTLEIQTPTGEVLIRRSIPPLGEGEQGTFEVQVDPSDIEMGFVALLDVGSIITERDETNNRITVDGAMTSMVSASIMAPASIIGVLLLISILGVIRWRRQGAGSVEERPAFLRKLRIGCHHPLPPRQSRTTTPQSSFSPGPSSMAGRTSPEVDAMTPLKAPPDTSSVRPSVGRCNLMDPSFARGSDMAPDEEVRRLLALSMRGSNRTSRGSLERAWSLDMLLMSLEEANLIIDHLIETGWLSPTGDALEVAPGLGRPRTPLGWVRTSTPSVRLKDPPTH